MSIIGEAFVRVRPETTGFEQDTKGAISGALERVGPLGAPLVALSAAAVGVVGALAGIGETFQNATNIIRSQTGATGPVLAGLRNDMKAVFSDVPTSANDAATAIATLAQRTGLAGKPLQDLATEQLNLARVTKQDLGASIESTTKAFANFGISAGQQAPKLDELFRASQRTGISVPQLAAELQKAGPILRTLGFSFEQSTALLAGLDKEGIASGPIIAGLRKSIADFAKEGKSAPEAIKATFDAIKNAKTSTEATTEALKVFGSRAGPQLADAIRGGKLEFQAFADALGKGDSINKAAADTLTLHQRLTLLKNQAFVALEPVATATLGLLERGMTKIGAAVKAVTPELTRLRDVFVFALNPKAEVDDLTGLEAVVGHFAKAFVTVRDALEEVFTFLQAHRPVLIGLGVAFGLVVAPVLTLGAAAVYLYARFQVVRDVVHAVSTAVTVAFQFIRTTVVPIVVEVAREVGARFQQMLAFIHSISGPFVEAAGHIFNAIRDTVTPTIQLIQAVWEASIGSMLAAARAIFEAIHAVVDGAIRAIEGAIRLVLDLINGDWGKAWNDMRAIVSGVWEAINGIVTGAIKAVADVIVGVMAVIGRGLENGFGAVLGFFTGIGNRMLAATGNLVGDFLSLGSRVVHGIADGMESAFNSITGFFGSLGSRILSSVKSGLGPLGKFLSPKTQFGVDIGNGLLLGIAHAVDTNAGVVTDAMARLQHRMGAGTSAPALAFGGGGSSGGGFPLTRPAPTSAAAGAGPLIGQVLIQQEFGPGTNAEDVKQAMRDVARTEVAETVERVVRLARSGPR